MINIIVPDLDIDLEEIREDIEEFCEEFEPLETDRLILLRDKRTGAILTECHINASKLVSLATTDGSLDPDDSSNYRSNRDLVSDHAAFQQMKIDAVEGRRFSNIVAEYVKGSALPLEIIGGQHRFEAIQEAFDANVEVAHGVKVYFKLDKEQRLDVQIISNTNISVSKDLLDRMFETLAGAELREWCQSCGLLGDGEDFADKGARGNPITVKEARTFIVNYYLGRTVAENAFEVTDTTPQVVQSGTREPDLWVSTKQSWLNMWEDQDLKTAGREYAELRDNQIKAFTDTKTGKPTATSDYRYKAKNIALLAGWAYVAGALKVNSVRLQRHYDLKNYSTKDPLRADLLAKGRHSSDPENYRGLGFRTDGKERGRFVELFWLQAEKGSGITKAMIEVAIQNYEAKQATLHARALRDKLQ